MTPNWLDRFYYVCSILVFCTIIFVMHEIYSAFNINLDNELNCSVHCPKTFTFDRGKSHDRCYCGNRLVRIYK
jgi:hypothetical protein